MGKKVMSVVGTVNPAIGLATGQGAFAKALGLEKGQGEYWNADESASQDLMGMNADQMYNQGTKSIQENALLSGLFGKEGLQSRLGTEEQRLATQGYQLTPEDREAYGQASGDISRLFGTQEQAAAQSLASRGLASAPSGVAGATFSGLQGNKMEQLAKAQTAIADRRMQNTMQRLNSTRQMMSDLGNQAGGLLNQQFNNRLGLAEARQGAQGQINQGRMASLADKRSQRSGSLLENFGTGLRGGVTNLGAQAPSMLASGGMPSPGASASTGGGGGFGGQKYSV